MVKLTISMLSGKQYIIHAKLTDTLEDIQKKIYAQMVDQRTQGESIPVPRNESYLDIIYQKKHASHALLEHSLFQKNR